LIDKISADRTYKITCSIAPKSFEKFDQVFIDSGLKVRSRKRTKSGEEMICIWHVYGSPNKHNKVIDQLFADSEVEKFEVESN
jgi:hypothetical protein